MELSLQSEDITNNPIFELRFEGLESRAVGEAIYCWKGDWPRDPQAENMGRTEPEQQIYNIDTDVLMSASPQGNRLYFETIEPIRVLAKIVSEYTEVVRKYPGADGDEFLREVGGLAADLLIAVNPTPSDIGSL